MTSLTLITPSRVDFDRDVQNRLNELDEDGDLTGWYCVATDPFDCPATGCSFVAHHLTAAHRIIVWEAVDDPRLLHHARLAQKVNRNPRVIEYARSMGPCISFDQWEAINRPIHARIERPDGWS